LKIATPLDVFRVEEDARLWLFKNNSLFDALDIIRGKGPGTYLVESQKSGLKRFYKVDVYGKLSFLVSR